MSQRHIGTDPIEHPFGTEPFGVSLCCWISPAAGRKAIGGETSCLRPTASEAVALEVLGKDGLQQ
jgi:hypothetical protein